MSENNEAPQNHEAPPTAPPEAPAGLSANPDERQFGLFVHLSALIGITGIPLASIIAPLVMWQIKKNESAFIDDQGKEAVNFNITVFIVAIGLLLLTLITFGIGAILTLPLGLALAVAWLVFTIIAGIKANEGVAYRYPFALRLIK